MTDARDLRELIKTRLFPYVEARGFARAKRGHPLFTTFRRRVGNKAQVFNVQWDKYGAPRFVVNFGEGPIEGVTLWGRHIPGDELEPQDCPESGRLQRKRGPYLRCWFQTRKPLLEAVGTFEWNYPVATVVDAAMAAFPEVEAWWENRAVGPHVTILPSDMWRVANGATRAG